MIRLLLLWLLLLPATALAGGLQDQISKTYIDPNITGYPTASLPANATRGQLAFDTTTNQLKVYNGSAWVASSGGGASTSDHFVTTTSDGDVANSTNLGALSTGYIKCTVSGGICTVSSDATVATAASTTTFTNKTLDCNGTGNSCLNFPGGGSSSEPINAQTGTTYTVLSGDNTKLVTYSNASAVAVTLPQAGGSFSAGWYSDHGNLNTGIVTITATPSTINGQASIQLGQYQAVRIVSDGTNYFTVAGVGCNPILGTNGQICSKQAGVPTWTNLPSQPFLGSWASDATPRTLAGAATDEGCVPMSNEAGTTWAAKCPSVKSPASGAAYTFVVADRETTVLGNGSSGAFNTYTLPDPTATSFPAGWRVRVYNNVASTLTIARTATATIDGGTSITFAQYKGGVIESDGTNWHSIQGSGGGSGTSTGVMFAATNTGMTWSTSNTSWFCFPGGCSNTGSSFQRVYQWKAPVAMHIVNVTWHIDTEGTTGSGGSGANFKFNNVTAATTTTGCSITVTSGEQTCTDNGNNLAVAQGDLVTTTFTTGTFTTAPTAMSLSAVISYTIP